MLKTCWLARAERTSLYNAWRGRLQYTLISSVALFAADGVMLLFGEIADRLGPRVAYETGAMLAWTALSLIGINSQINSSWLWYVAFFCLGISGPGVFLGSLFIGEKHPELRAVVTSFSAAMWDSSAVVFLGFHALYFESGMGLDHICILWLSVCIVLGVATRFVLPTLEDVQRLRVEASGGAPTEEVVPSAEDSAEDAKAEESLALAGEVLTERSPKGESFTEQFFRYDTMLLLAFMSVYNLKSSFYITTFEDQMLELFPIDTAESLALTFDAAFPVGGFFTSIVASIVLEKFGTREDIYMSIVLLLAVTFGLCNLLPFVATQYISALLFGPTRTIQWACYFHFLSLPSRYSAEYSGRLLGYGNLVIALVGDVPPYLLNNFVTSGSIGSISDRYLLVHLVLQLGLLCCLALPIHLTYGRRRTPSAYHDSAFEPAERVEE